MSGWIIFAALAPLMAIVAVFLDGDARLRRRLRRLGATPIAEVTAGRTAKLVGKLSYASEPLRAPLSGRACAGFEVLVDGGDEGATFRESRFVDFILDDGTGRAIVRVGTPEASVVKDLEQRSGWKRPVTPAMRALLERHRCSVETLGLPTPWRYLEGVLEEGELVAVVGVCRREPDPDPRARHGYRAVAERVVVEAGSDGRVAISDDPALTA